MTSCMTALSTTLWFYDICHARHFDSLDRTSVYCRTIASHRHRYNSLAESRLAGCPFDLYCPFIRRLCEHPLETQTETPHIFLDTVPPYVQRTTCPVLFHQPPSSHSVSPSWCYPFVLHLQTVLCCSYFLKLLTSLTDSCPNNSPITAFLFLSFNVKPTSI